MPKWTSDQIKVISSRDNNILVSAAAGSGKTAVLVERIINKIVNDKVGADNLLVVTFTKAAAGEMKVRIKKALDNAIKADPDNDFLLRQNTLITSADISTIDSFCNKLVKDNYNDLGVDPAFRICDEGEETLLFAEAFGRVLDDNFEAPDNEAFINMINLYCDTNDYSDIGSIVEGLYKRAVSYPWPKEWLDNISKAYILDDGSDISGIKWLSDMHASYIQEISDINKELSVYYDSIKNNLVYGKNGKNKTETNINNAINYLEELSSTSDMGELYSKSIDIKKMSKGEATFLKSIDMDAECDEAKKLYMIYELLCNSYNALYEDITANRIDDILEEISYVSDYALVLISLTKQVMDVFDEIKADECAYTFNDIEHFALNILIDPDTKQVTDTALGLKDTYNEIMVDEYQDINDLQEMILSTLSNGHNMFMVGDVKQSIYGFRMAKPDIFVGKCDSFALDEHKGILINLMQNFRSRREVLDVVNDIFAHIMTRATSGFDYDDKAKLYYGAKDSFDDDLSADPEIIIVDVDEDETLSSREVEATVVAERIRDLIDSHYQVKDTGKNGEIIARDIRYCDIAIILRAANTNGKVYEDALLNANVPCHSVSNKGYFDTIEVRLMLSFLSVIDNPCRDIELAAVLHSPIFGVSNDMLARIRLHGKTMTESESTNLYHEMIDYIDSVEKADAGKADEVIADIDILRLKNAVTIIQELRLLSNDTLIHELLETIYERTGYLDFVTAQINGQYKRANLLALVDRALDYEKTNFRGVFRFLRYIETMREYDLDTGEASIMSENDDVVRILTMHKSKGLEYPIVFVCDLGSRMVDQDINESNIIHNSLGLGLELRRSLNGNRYKKDTQYKQYIKRVKKQDFMAEEARLLYVATTRAREKLILTGAFKKAQDTVNSYRSGKMNYARMINAKSRMEWIIRGLNTSNPNSLDTLIHYRSPSSEMLKEIIDYAYINERQNQLRNSIAKVSQELIDEIDIRLSYEYPYEINDSIKSKYSVSDIKHDAIAEAFEEETEARPDFIKEERESIIPHFIGGYEEEVNKGALYGTAMHRVMECFDFVRDDYDTSLKSQLDYMMRSNLLSDDQLGLISESKLNNFLKTDMAKKMHDAAVSDKLWIEQPFVSEQSPSALFDDVSDNLGNVIIQGIIDVFFEDDGAIVLLDYKTDKVDNDDELIKRYKAQIDLYAKAIEDAMQLQVRDKILYSFCLDKVVVL